MKTKSEIRLSLIKKIFDALHKFVFRSALTFSVASLIIAAISAKQQTGINGIGYIYFALFAVLIAVSMLITDILKKYTSNTVVTGTVQFVLCYLSFAVLFYLMKDMIATNSFNSPVASFIFLSIAFVGIYCFIAVIKIVAGMVKRKILLKDVEYENIYK